MTFLGRITQGSKTIMLFVAQSRARKRKVAIVAVLLVVAAVVAVVLVVRHQGAEARARVARSWSSLSRCLLGDPLKPGDRASAQFRARQLTAMTLSAAKRAAAEGKAEAWPERCARFGHALSEALDKTSAEPGPRQELARAAAQFATRLGEQGAVLADLSPEVDRIWELGGQANIERVAVSDVPDPPEPVETLTVDSVKSIEPLTETPIDMKLVQGEVHPSQPLRMIVADKQMSKSPALCEFAASGASARCQQLPGDIAKATHGGFSLLGTADKDAAPLVFAGKDGSDGVFDSDSGALVAQIESRGGYVAGDGVIFVLGWDAASRQLRLLRKQGAKDAAPPTPHPVTVPPTTLEIDDPASNVQLLWDQLVMRGTNKFDELWLFCAEVGTTGAAIGQLVPVGQLAAAKKAAEPQKAAETVRIAGCRSSKATVIQVDDGTVQFLSFLIDGKWTKPVKLEQTGGVLSCEGTNATVTAALASPDQAAMHTRLSHHRCSPASCRSHTVTVEQMLKGEPALGPSALVAAAGLGDQLLVVWGAGERGGLRLRLAAPAQIGTSPDVIVFDNLVEDGKVQATSTLRDMRLLSGTGFAILLLSTKIGVHALRIEPDGKLELVRFQWAS